MRKLTNARYALPLLLLAWVIPVHASRMDMDTEIAHLLAYVETTPCQYERNGDFHDGKQAVEHIRNKYQYFQNRIDSTEKFIELSATRSTVSGRYYLIHCTGELPVKSRDWLLRELGAFRSKRTGHAF